MFSLFFLLTFSFPLVGIALLSMFLLRPYFMPIFFLFHTFLGLSFTSCFPHPSSPTSLSPRVSLSFLQLFCISRSSFLFSSLYLCPLPLYSSYPSLLFLLPYSSYISHTLFPLTHSLPLLPLTSLQSSCPPSFFLASPCLSCLLGSSSLESPIHLFDRSQGE